MDRVALGRVEAVEVAALVQLGHELLRLVLAQLLQVLLHPLRLPPPLKLRRCCLLLHFLLSHVRELGALLERVQSFRLLFFEFGEVLECAFASRLIALERVSAGVDARSASQVLGKLY